MRVKQVGMTDGRCYQEESTTYGSERILSLATLLSIDKGPMRDRTARNRTYFFKGTLLVSGCNCIDKVSILNGEGEVKL